MSIQTIASLLELEMYSEAWDALEALPEDLKEVPIARRLRLRVASALGRWKTASRLAGELRHGNTLDKEAAALCFHAIAAELFKRGRLEDARRMALQAIDACSEQRERIHADPRFPENFLSRRQQEREDAA